MTKEPKIPKQYPESGYTYNSAIIAINTFLPEIICDSLINQYSPRERKDATIKYYTDIENYEVKTTPEVRKTEIFWIPENEWVAGMISYYIDKINTHHFNYDISGGISGNSFQYSVYQDGGFYDWHNDETRSLYDLIGKENVRKLSFSLQLSDENDYDGGELVFLDPNGKEIIQSKKKGTLVIFDSRQFHKVNPVTRGVRHSLVGWYLGPNWR